MINFCFLGGIIGFSLSQGTILRWELSSHVVAKIKPDMEERRDWKKMLQNQNQKSYSKEELLLMKKQ